MSAYTEKRAVVVGGTHGMGEAIARRLVHGGAQVIVTGRNEQNIEAAREQIGPGAHLVRSDVTSMADIDQFVEYTRTTFGGGEKCVDYVFLNAGTAALQPFEAVTEESYDHQFAVNTKGLFFTVQRLLPLVADGGALVFTTSIADEGGTPLMSVYSATKAALFSLAQVLAAELLPRGIRVNAVSPGFIDTPTMGVPGMAAEEKAVFQKLGDELTPMRRHGSADEVARAAIFLAADATFTTGVKLPVDGGLGQKLSYPQL